MDSQNFEQSSTLYGHSTPLKRTLMQRMRHDTTEAEQLLWHRLKGNREAGLHFRRQQPIHGFIADFYCHALRLIVELDGGVHTQQQDYDRERDDILKTNGYTILRSKNQDVYERREWVVHTIRAFAGRVSQPILSPHSLRDV